MKISVFGLGYVGTVTAACLSHEGHTITGVDPNAQKLELLGQGQSPIVEVDVPELLERAHASGKLRASSIPSAAVAETDLSIVCVGTPSQGNGALDLRFLRSVCGEIGQAIATKAERHTVVIRSTVLPGTHRDVIIPALEEASRKRVGTGFGVAHNPEFLREGTAVADFRNPPKTVIGASDDETAATVASLYAHLDAPLVQTKLSTAEMVKYTDNCWHAVKVAFGNEIGRVCKAIDVDSHEVMDIFFKDTQLNISRYYLRPGYAYGGSCLPKDLRALNYRARSLDVELPLLRAVSTSNEEHINHALRLVMGRQTKRVGILGFAFKAGTDDLRESPIVELIERLIGKGYDLKLYDRNVNLARLTGANRDYINNAIPHISKLMVDTPVKVVEHADVVIIGNGAPEFANVLADTRSDQVVIDLVRLPGAEKGAAEYHGICW